MNILVGLCILTFCRYDMHHRYIFAIHDIYRDTFDENEGNFKSDNFYINIQINQEPVCLEKITVIE